MTPLDLMFNGYEDYYDEDDEEYVELPLPERFKRIFINT